MKRFDFEKYSLNLKEESFGIEINGVEIFDFSVRTPVNSDKPDKDSEIIGCSVKGSDKSVSAVWTTVSSNWEKKEYILEADKNVFRYYVRVYGKGAVERVIYFGGGKNLYEAGGYYTPVAPHGGVENRHFTMSESFSISLGYMVPPPLCYSFSTEGLGRKIGISLCAKPGEYNFDKFDYEFHSDKYDFSFETDYYGYQRADGMFETAHIMGVFGESDIEILKNYRYFSFEYGYARQRSEKKYDWWNGPLFCGWGEQCWLNGQDPFSLATQSEYTKMCDKLDERGIYTTAVIIDDKWQRFYGEALPDTEKWPDMRAFTDEQHKKGRRVMLWFKLWNGEGLTDGEQIQCICRPVGADPTSERYVKRIEYTMRKLLSDEDGCFNCDGFKIDFANCMPLGRGLSTAEKGIYGIELLKRMFSLIYKYAKAVKPDVLINNSCCHPYFAEVTDQVRLHDYYLGVRNAETTLKNRSVIYKAIMNEASVDTDGPNCQTKRDTMRYMEYASKIGVLDLYFITNDIFDESDWGRINELFEKHKRPDSSI